MTQTVSISRLCSDGEPAYDEFLRKLPTTLIYASIPYRNLLCQLTGGSERYLIARNDIGEIIGVLPSILSPFAAYGPVLNSLPFYGSNGGVILSENAPENTADELIQAFDKMAMSEGCCSSTLITSPLDPYLECYQLAVNYDFRDERVGQITHLPKESADLTDVLMKMIHQKTRNMVRKAEKSGFRVSCELSNDSLKFLYETHQENMREIGGLAKSWDFFTTLSTNFKYGQDFKIWVAYTDETPVAALLLLYFNQSVEYFTPVIVKAYRSFQPLSLLIFKAMEEAINNGYEYWNWGGTWLSQKGVYNFKKRWGTSDHPYHYYTKVYDKRLLGMTQPDLLSQYSLFYVVPFSALTINGQSAQIHDKA